MVAVASRRLLVAVKQDKEVMAQWVLLRKPDNLSTKWESQVHRAVCLHTDPSPVHTVTVYLDLSSDLLCLCFCSDMGSRAGYPTQVYKTTSAETPRPSQLSQCSPFQLSTSVPKSFFSKQPAHNKHSTGWKRADEPPPRPLPFTDSKK